MNCPNCNREIQSIDVLVDFVTHSGSEKLDIQIKCPSDKCEGNTVAFGFMEVSDLVLEGGML